MNLDDGYEEVASRSRCCYEHLGPESGGDGGGDGGGGEPPRECRAAGAAETRGGCAPPRSGAGHGGTDPARGGRGGGGGADGLTVRLVPEGRGRHMVVISNCAYGADGEGGEGAAAGLKAVVGQVTVGFASRFGELPLSMMGIIPFYGALLAAYATLAAVWWGRTRGAGGGSGAGGGQVGPPPPPRHPVHAAPLLLLLPPLRPGPGPAEGPQGPRPSPAPLHRRGLRLLPAPERDRRGRRRAVLRDGPQPWWTGAPGAWRWRPRTSPPSSGARPSSPLATDGTWLLQRTAREGTARVLYGLAAAWAAFFVLHGRLGPTGRGRILLAMGVGWVAFLLYNVRRSLRHLRALMVGQGQRHRHGGGGGALVAKRSMYRRMFAVIAAYPAVFVAGLLWSARAGQDSWGWVGYVLVDACLFAILLHASVIWLPRPMAGREYAKYAPLEVSVNAASDRDLWEEGIPESWSGDEGEMEEVELRKM